MSQALRIAITTGEPAGIGPELMYHLSTCEPSAIPLTARSATGIKQNTPCPIELVLIGDRELLHERMSLWNLDFKLVDYQANMVQATGAGQISVYHTPLAKPSTPGHMDNANAPYVLSTLDLAIKGCLSGDFNALVTGPISKSVIASLGIDFTGHTEYLQQQTNTKEVVMMLGCNEMNVALATTHLPLKDVAAAITAEKLTNIIEVLHRDLRIKMGFRKPKIYVCGINPHAGEDGTLGREELDVVIPVLEQLRAQGMDLVGPLPADTIFQPKYLEDASVILTMYHDQGLPVLKYVDFDSGYNTTLGLPFIRTSVDHGTALSLAGQAVANPNSLKSAVSLAIYMAQHHH